MKHFRKLSFFLFLVCCLVLVSFPVIADSGDTQEARDFFGFIEWLFIPADDFFIREMSAINDRINAKLGGVAYLYQTIDNFLKSLFMPDVEPVLNFNMPDNFLFNGYKGLTVNLFEYGKPFIKFFRDVINTTLCIMTAIACYHKLRTLFSE